MDNKYKQKVKRFFKKEGFYVVLFLCLCLVATVTAISYKVSSKNNTKTEITKNGDNAELSINTEDKNKITSEIQNAERVAKDKVEQKVEDKANTTETTKAVTASAEVEFNKPVDGLLLRGYTYPKPVRVDDKNQRTIRGIDIEAKVGTEVKSAAEGIVESVSNNGVEEGMTVVVIHANGIKTKYTNLDSEVALKKDDKVTKDTVVGKVGLTAKVYNKEEFGEHLNLQVLDSKDEQMDPLKYFEYKGK